MAFTKFYQYFDLKNFPKIFENFRAPPLTLTFWAEFICDWQALRNFRCTCTSSSNLRFSSFWGTSFSLGVVVDLVSFFGLLVDFCCLHFWTSSSPDKRSLADDSSWVKLFKKWTPGCSINKFSRDDGFVSYGPDTKHGGGVMYHDSSIPYEEDLDDDRLPWKHRILKLIL